ncbi:MAG: efflux RND transporter periplasmic adaptor subunit [Pseudomonadales bacterium]|nr:efflux RND transporter periplasmic adaptor subunit [Pseudomonadales bacterium]
MNSNNKNNNTRSSRFLRHFLFPLLIVFLAIVAAVYLKLINKPVEKKAREQFVSQVHVQAVNFESLTIPVLSQGVVAARTQTRLISEVSGKVNKVSAKWVNGGFFRKGEEILQIEDYEYKNQLAKAKAQLASAKSALIQEQGHAYVAKEDWQRRNSGGSNKAAKSLALREPQLESARTQLEAAKTDLVSARHRLIKTRIKAPYDGLVSGKQADIGQFISTGQLLADYHAVDYVEIRLPLTGSQLRLLELPKIGQQSDIPVTLESKVGDEVFSWQGRFVRTEGMLDEFTKVLYGVVEVQDPYGLNKPANRPLRIGSFVEASIKSKILNDIVVLPRNVLRSGNILWLVDNKNKLQRRKVAVLPTREEMVYVISGLAEGERVVVSGIAEAVAGREVTIRDDMLLDSSQEGASEIKQIIDTEVLAEPESK